MKPASVFEPRQDELSHVHVYTVSKSLIVFYIVINPLFSILRVWTHLRMWVALV